MAYESGVRRLLALRVAFVNSFRRVVRSGVHQAFDFGEGRKAVVFSAIVAVSAEGAEENYSSSWLGDGLSEGGGTS